MATRLYRSASLRRIEALNAGAPLMRGDVARMNKIVGQAMQAGCYHRP